MSKRRNKRQARKKKALQKAKKSIRIGGHTHAVTVDAGFWASLEKYAGKKVSSMQVPWEWVGIGLTLLVIVSSIAAGYFRTTPLYGSSVDMIRQAASLGDYQTAQALMKNQVLGVATELEELVYPERVLLHKIQAQEELLAKYPGSRDILLTLSKLYRETGNAEKAQAYWEQARVLDPNNEIFK